MILFKIFKIELKIKIIYFYYIKYIKKKIIKLLKIQTQSGNRVQLS